MTIGQLVECLLGKAACEYGGFGECTAFSTKGANYDTYGHMLTRMGYHNSGNQLLYNGFTGEQIYSEIFIGPTYYMRLKHMVKDKINYRATGKRNFLTRQTNQGRANDGGLKIGEMERDGIMANGLSYFLNESYMVRGDQYYMGVCNKTGAIAVYNPDTNLFLSPLADGPLVFNKNIEGQEVLNAISKFGRSFSIVRVPFALKLLIQELQVMNIQMRIITEENIDQLLNLSYQSKNINKLLHIDHGEDGKAERDVKEIIENYKKTLEDQLKIQSKNNITIQKAEPIEPRNIEYTPEQPSPQYMPDQSSSSPQYMLDQSSSSPQYISDFTPNTPEGSPPPSKGGANIFNDSFMNETFNNLSGEQQSQILQIPEGQRENVMNEIMRKGGIIQPNLEKPLENSLENPLNNAFKALPQMNQVIALQGGYNSMAKEFNNLAKQIPDTLVTIKKPIPITEQLAQQLPLFAVEQKGGTTTSTETESNTSTSSIESSIGSSNESSNESSNGITKIIKMN
jgi:hypothetical protein